MYYTVIKHSGHLRTLEKCTKHSPAARVFYISLVFSNACCVLSQCNTRLRLLYLLNINLKSGRHFYESTFFFVDFNHFFNAITLQTKITYPTYNIDNGRKKRKSPAKSGRVGISGTGLDQIL